jgi:hypothetical protein
MQEYDKSSKWLIQHHGDSILRLAGLRDIVSWKALQAELVQSRRLPDGLLEVRTHEDEPDHYVLEIATYPEARVVKQVARDTALVFLDRDIIPEVLVLFLRPRGNVDAVGGAAMRSRRGWTNWPLSWKVVKLWELNGAELLAAGEIGLVPWVPLTLFDDPPESIVRQCRDRIDRDASPNEHENLLAVTQLLARLRYNNETLFQILGGPKAMIESPLLQELKAEWERENIAKVLEARFGVAGQVLGSDLNVIDEDRLDDLLKLAATCRSLASFRKKLAP